MTALDIPGNILIDGQPPELISDGSVSWVKAFMAEIIMSLLQDAKLVYRFKQDLLVLVSPFLAPEVIPLCEVLMCSLLELETLPLKQRLRELKRGEVISDMMEVDTILLVWSGSKEYRAMFCGNIRGVIPESREGECLRKLHCIGQPNAASQYFIYSFLNIVILFSIFWSLPVSRECV